MTRERLEELMEQNEEDLILARAGGLRGWVVTLTARRHSLKDIEAGLPVVPEADDD